MILLASTSIMRFFPFIILLFFTLSLAGHDNNTASHKHAVQNCFFKLGDKLLSIARHGDQQEAPFVLISLHSNETTAIEAAKNFIANGGGLFLELLNYNQRLIQFTESKRKFVFDPNRIFTPAGRIANLKKNRSYNKMVESEVQQFARFVLAEIPSNKTIIAVHNNDEGNYTIRDYKKGNRLAKHAELIFHNPELDEDDFFLTTDVTIFKNLSTKKFNVVLQHKRRANDDGSLSIYCERNSNPYVNVETEHGHLDEQQEMLTALKDILQK